jgi:hypothetical protein
MNLFQFDIWVQINYGVRGKTINVDSLMYSYSFLISHQS